jgi:hypothetical protein
MMKAMGLWSALGACLVLGLCGVATAQPIVTDGLTVYYSFDEFGTEVADESENGLNGSVFGQLLPSADAVRGGGSAFFDDPLPTDALGTGVAIGGCDVDYPEACEAIPRELLPITGLTLAVWVRVEEMRGDQSLYQPWSLDGSFVTHAQLQGDGQVRFRLRGQIQDDNINSTDKWFVAGDGFDPYPVGEWFHLVGTYSMEDDQIAIYYNGELVVDERPDLNIELGDWGTAATIGVVPDNRTSRPFYGNMDEYYIFNRAITQEEVGLLYNLVEPGGPTKLQAGDSDQDLDFDQFDLIIVQQAAKYLSNEAATWGDGDWNGAPGGSQGSPPDGDGFFNQLDIIAALNNGLYLKGSYGAILPGGTRDDGQTSIVYYAQTGEVAVDAPAGTELTSVNIESTAGIFTGDPAENLGGSFDNQDPHNLFKATFGSSFGSLSFGNVAQAGLTQEFLLTDLAVVGSLTGGGALGDVDLIYIPEPASGLLLLLGTAALVLATRRQTR